MADVKKSGNTQDVDSPEKDSPTAVANESAQKDAAARIEAHETAGRAAVVSDAPITAGADAFAEAAVKVAESVKFDDEGRVIGVDGKNPVSNENPDPRAVRPR